MDEHSTNTPPSWDTYKQIAGSRPIQFTQASSKSTLYSTINDKNGTSTTVKNGDDVVDFYTSLVQLPPQQQQQDPITSQNNDTDEDILIFCDDCQIYIPIHEQQSHQTSIPHQLAAFGSNIIPVTSSTSTSTSKQQLPESPSIPTTTTTTNGKPIAYALNAKTCAYGYNLLVSQGWKINQGLGKEGEGIKEPIQPVMKTDTKGLGMKSRKKRKDRVEAEAGSISSSSSSGQPRRKKDIDSEFEREKRKRLAIIHYLNKD